MCQSQSEGGRRCAAHIKPLMEKAQKNLQQASRAMYSARARAMEASDEDYEGAYALFEAAKDAEARAQAEYENLGRDYWITASGYSDLKKLVKAGKFSREVLAQIDEERAVIARAKQAHRAAKTSTESNGRPAIKVTQRANERPAACASCKHEVSARAGSLSKQDGAWVVYHKPGDCPEGEPAAREPLPDVVKGRRVMASRYNGTCPATGEKYKAGEQIVQTDSGAWIIARTATAESLANTVKTVRKCANCDEPMRGLGTMRTDSSGMRGAVCDGCRRESWLMLSFG